MNAKEYLNQAYRLEQRIELAKMEIEGLQELACCAHSPGFKEHYNSTGNTEAPFIKTMYNIMDVEDVADKWLQVLLKLKTEITQAISEVADRDERLVLQYRYLYNWTWYRIEDEIAEYERTVRRWYNRALSNFAVPDNPQLLMKNKMCRKCPRLLDSLYDILKSAKKDKGNTHTASMEKSAGAFIMPKTRNEESYSEKTQTCM